jgi:hypothetical protein
MQQAVLSPSSAVPLQLKPRNPERISSKHQYVLALHLAGAKTKEISEITKYNIQTIYKILNREDVIGARQQIMNNLDKEFEAQYEKVIDAVNYGLSAPEPNIRLQAAKLWGDYHKKFQKVEVNQSVNITAEDIVFNIMNNNYEDTNPSTKLLTNR